jgi:hypothetical protein
LWRRHADRRRRDRALARLSDGVAEADKLDHHISTRARFLRRSPPAGREKKPPAGLNQEQQFEEESHARAARSVIEKIIPLLPLRDPRVMTPQSARDALRQLAASRADVPPPPVEHVKEIAVAGGAGPVPAAYRNGKGEAPTIVFFHGRLGRRRSRNA